MNSDTGRFKKKIKRFQSIHVDKENSIEIVYLWKFWTFNAIYSYCVTN